MVILSLIVIIVRIVALRIEIIKDERWLNNKKHRQFDTMWNKKNDILSKSKKEIKFWLAGCAMIFVIMVGMFCKYQEVYAMTDEFVWSKEEQGDSPNSENASFTFSVVKRNDIEREWKEALYFSWYETGFPDGIIDKEGIEYYKNEIISMSSIQNVRRDKIKDVNTADSDFCADMELFKNTVASKENDVETLWAAYQAGVHVQKCYDTSENVFQTGVLAERTQVYAYATDPTNKENMKYTAAVFIQFDKFLSFEELYIGAGNVIDSKKVSFRKAKAAYRESTEGIQGKEAEEHCGALAYAYFSYLADITECTDKNYLLYVHYSGLAYLNILPDVEDEVYREELRMKELSRWEELDLETDYCNYNVENVKLEVILSTYNTLQRN